MMRILFYILLFLTVVSCKKETKAVESVLGKIDIDVKNHDLRLSLTKLSYTDSVVLRFSSIDSPYNCNLYRINYAAEQEAANHKYTMGNVFYAQGFCVFGLFPAMATHQAKDFAIGDYKLSVTKNNQTVTGTLKVTASNYVFDWQHDAILKIESKIVNR